MLQEISHNATTAQRGNDFIVSRQILALKRVLIDKINPQLTPDVKNIFYFIVKT